MENRNAGRKNSLLFAIFIVFVLAMAQNVLAANEEKVKVGIFDLNGFYQKNEEGQPEGYGIDYLDKVAEKAGWSYEYIWLENWDECVEYLRDGRVDMIAPAQKNEERMQEFDFSSFSIGMECGALLALSTNEKLIYEDFKTFGQIRIGCVDSLVFKDSFIQYGQEHGFSPSFVSYRDTKALMAALNSGEVDAALVNLFVKTDTTKVLAKFGIAPFYFMVRKDQNAFLRELNEALRQIKIEFTDFETNLIEQYYPDFNNTPFTKAEREFIASAPVFRIGCRSNIPPLSDMDPETGEAKGITRDILDEISQFSGLKFEYVPLPEGIISYDYFRENNITLISSVEYNKENVKAPGIKLTIPYIDSKKVFVCNKEELFDTEQKMNLALATGSSTLITIVQKEYPNFQLTLYDNIEECFEAVRKGTCDALLQNQYVVTPFLSKPQYSDMVIIPVESLKDQLCLSPIVNQQKGVESELLSDDRLISILNKSIKKITTENLNKIIIKQTTENQYRHTYSDFAYQYRYPIAAITAILLALFAVLWKMFHIKRKSMQLIMENETKLRNIANNINGGVVVLSADDSLRITYANDGFLELLQCGREDYNRIENQEYTAYVHPEDTEELKGIMSMDMKIEKQVSFKLRIMRKDGQYIPTLFNGTLTENSKGEKQIYCVIMDISEQEALLDEISLEQKKYSILMESSGDIIFEVDYQKHLIVVSSLFEEKFGWELQKANIADPLSEPLRLLRIHEDDLGEMEHITAKVVTQKVYMEGQARLKKSDGEYLWCRITQYPMVNAEGAVVDIIGKILDINDEVLEREQLEQISRTDALTGLMNKTAFFAEAEAYLKTGIGKNTVIVFIDMDNFKQINDRLGHMTGDIAIKETAKKLQTIFSNFDLLARFGGDEFCVLLKEIPEETLKDKLAWTVEKLRATYTADGESVSCSASIGAVCTYGREAGLDEMLECADKALYYVKENGKDQYMIYHDGLAV